MHTYICTCIHTYIHLHSYIHTYRRNYSQTSFGRYPSVDFRWSWPPWSRRLVEGSKPTSEIMILKWKGDNAVNVYNVKGSRRRTAPPPAAAATPPPTASATPTPTAAATATATALPLPLPLLLQQQLLLQTTIYTSSYYYCDGDVLIFYISY